jgi:tRNA pseudouridine38-40 synthase
MHIAVVASWAIDMQDGVRTIALLVSYFGPGFKGYAKQPNRRTVQHELESAWFELTGENVDMLASGRTDSGVHAFGQVVHFVTSNNFDATRISRSLNSQFDDDLVVRESVEVAPKFHASESAVLKHYVYRIATGHAPPVLDRFTCEWVPQQLDIAAMRNASQFFLGTHDFESFAAAGRTTSTTVRTVTNMHIQLQRGRILIHVRGTGFLYKMVRNMVGSLLEVGRQRRPAEWIGELLIQGDRNLAGATAAAKGLTLYRVHYLEEPFSQLHKPAPQRYPKANPNSE